MGKWSVMELIGISAEDKQDFQEIYLSPYEVEASESNFYSQENIEELADSIRMVGQQQPTVLGRVDGVYKIISGHRRNLANIHNIETGAFPRDYLAKYLYKDMTPAMLELSLIVGNAFNRKLTPYEETEQAARLKAALIRARDEDGLEITGKLRDVVADILQTSRTKVARMDKINNSLAPEAREQFKAGKLGKSAAYETAKLPEEEQRQIAAQAAAGEKVQHKDVAQKVTEKVAEKKAEQAAARAEKAAKKAEAAQTAAAQAGLQAERAAESADSSATRLTEAHMNPPEPDEQQEWTTRDWAIYHLRELMSVASYITEDDLIVLQDILVAATGRKKDEDRK
ncbi:ParB/RepB/Spo0J family partition protein [Enterocloster lavalensis]|uniref:ParB/RepB/Spo0J family partition protein n=1 Tax=Enterocloster lavalensis TaxID=460384 RepID=UPI002666D0C2|nr:ParB N-terminal domain-containing protein [Enterocloster lavalensis]